MLSTSELRTAWACACNPSLLSVEIVQGVRVQCHESAKTAVRALGLVMQAHGYVVRQRDTGGYNCRPITGGTGYSLHAYGIAVDINWNTNPYRIDNKLITDMPQEMVADILRIRTSSGKQVWGWGGNYPNHKDTMHYEIVCTPADLATGIDWNTVNQPALRPAEPQNWPLVQRGDRGPAVEKLHELLGVAAAGEPGFGIFGPKTEAAVRTYQEEHGLTVDGTVGQQTWTALLSGQPEVAAGEPGPVKRMTTT
jgi:hypothetical protein